MKQALNYFKFINSQTGNVIAYLSLPVDMDDTARTKNLEKRKAEAASDNKMNVEVIYWQDQDHPIQ